MYANFHNPVSIISGDKCHLKLLKTTVCQEQQDVHNKADNIENYHVNGYS
jgi:hypothetical protein